MAQKIDKILRDTAIKIMHAANIENLNYFIDEKLVFVIIAFDDDMEYTYKGIKAAGEKLGLKVVRVSDYEEDIKISEKIIELIRTANFVVADLSKDKPNVFFELGYARGLGKNIISIANTNHRITLPFDVKDWRCEFYSDSRQLEDYLSKRLQKELDRQRACNDEDV